MAPMHAHAVVPRTIRTCRLHLELPCPHLLGCSTRGGGAAIIPSTMSSGADVYHIDLATLKSITEQPYLPDVVQPIAGGVRVGHVAHILRVLSAASATRHADLPNGDGAALHSIVFHLAGGVHAELTPPPRRGADLKTMNITAHLLRAAKAYGPGSTWAKAWSKLKMSGGDLKAKGADIFE